MTDSLFTDEPAPAPVQFTDEPAPTEKTLAGFGRNVVRDVKDNASGIGNLIGNAIEHPLDTAVSTVKGLPGAVVNEGKRLGVGELLTGHPINAADKFLDAAYDKPITTASEVIPAAGALGKLGEVGKVLEGGEAGAAAARAAAEAGAEGAEATGAEKAAQAANVAAEGAPAGASEAAGAPKPPPVAESDPLGEVKGYVNRYYENQAKQPGWSNTVAEYLQRHSQNMAVKQLGASPLQAKQLGEEATRAIGQYALDKGIVSPTVGEIGMGEKTAALNKAAGKTLGDLRAEADSLRDPAVHPIDVMQEVRKRLDQKYARGVNSGESGNYAKALEDIEDAEASHQGIADLSTKLNKAANDANKLKQPHGAFTDVANTVSEVNNERIKTLLGPQKAAQYEAALREFGVTKKIQEFLKRRSSREIAGRIGPGGITRELGQKFLDELGYKTGARITNRMSRKVLENPAMAGNLPSMFKEFINQVEELGEEPSGMAYGGVVGVPQDVAQYVTR